MSTKALPELKHRMSGGPSLLRFAALAALALCAGCAQKREHPPLASDGYEPSEPRVEQTDLIEETGGSTACGETAIELPIKRPNFYFLLDSSESMLDTMPHSGGKDRHSAARAAIADMLTTVGHRVNFGAAVFPAPQSDGACAPGEEVFELRPGDSRVTQTDELGPQLNALLFNLRKLTPSGATPVTSTLQELSPMLEALESRTFLFLLTDGAPNCDTDGCTSDKCIANIESFSFEDGSVCDDSLNCCQPGLLSHLCLDDSGASKELRKLNQGGVRTYIIGFPGSETYAEVLDGMARSAGTAQPDAGTGYYQVEDVEQLAKTLTALGQELSLDCTLELEEEPERPDLVRVFADDDELQVDDDDGWEWVSEARIDLLGDACETWKSGEWFRIDIVEGCETRVR